MTDSVEGRAAASGLVSVSLDDKYDLAKERIFVSGTQAIVQAVRLGLVTL